MNLEDALFCLVIDPSSPEGVGDLCEAAIAGGVDLVVLQGEALSSFEEVRAVCRRDDALLVVDSGFERFDDVNGIHTDDLSAPVGYLRSLVPGGGYLGMSTHTLQDVMVASEVDVDFVLHWQGHSAFCDFAALPHGAGSILYAAGVETVDDVLALVDHGVYRIAMRSSVLVAMGDVQAGAVSISSALGRVM